ncbi:MAG TPA: ADP-ribosylglycohydrolase family protein [Lentisphaeria bacterium]|nr:ADP-ribosylglycohydrolase family protein [Lentisphaeria bacterium]
MLGAIIGDIVGSRFEWHNHCSKRFKLFTADCFFTDDTVMTLAVAQAILEAAGDYKNLGQLTIKNMQKIGRRYPDCGYGGMFANWMFSDQPQPYNSFGNGAAMRVSACGFAATSLQETLSLAQKVTEVTHNHPEGIKGAQATAAAVFLARTGHDQNAIRAYIEQNYYPLTKTVDEIRPTYQFNETCQETVPQAITAFLEADSFEDALRNAISIGGDSDTVAAITGGIAEAAFDIPADIRNNALPFLDDSLRKILINFENTFPKKP